MVKIQEHKALLTCLQNSWRELERLGFPPGRLALHVATLTVSAGYPELAAAISPLLERARNKQCEISQLDQAIDHYTYL